MKESSKIKIERTTARSYTVPTEGAESDGTLTWNSTTMVLVRAEGGGKTGLGYSYTDRSAATLINNKLSPLLQGLPAMDLPRLWRAMVQDCRNLGDSALTMTAVSAVDAALWDLKARILEVPLVTLLGAMRRSVPIYGSGGFTSYDLGRLTGQLAGWRDMGITRMKLKIGREPDRDPERLRAARQAVGEEAELMVDANGGYTLKQALAMAEVLKDCGVTWFEEPVHHRDLTGLRILRGSVPAGIEISSGEYGFNLDYFSRLLDAEAVDVLQADATRCSPTVFIEAAALCRARFLPFSSHTAPALHCHLCCSLASVRHMEYFHDHVRIEQLFFDGLPEVKGGEMHPHFDRPGMGLVLKEKDAEKFLD